MTTHQVKLGDSIEVLRQTKDCSVDAIVTDPPYGLSFMGKKWDYDVPSVELWKECLRVLKPGGHMLVACGTRTQHRMAVNIEDAGFEIRDVITWLYGSGFPKSLDISKAIDKAAGAEREKIGISPNHRTLKETDVYCGQPHVGDGSITAPSTPEAKQWQGWGTALKPSAEFWTLARKPLSESTVAKNVLKHGTGGINVDGCRVESSGDHKRPFQPTNNDRHILGKQTAFMPTNAEGRFPANLILDEEAGAALDEQSGPCKTGDNAGVTKKNSGNGSYGSHKDRVNNCAYKDIATGASRFFYCPKASKSERNNGAKEAFNNHATVKPIKLMRYLCRLITPPGGTVLDPFLGSGSTLVAAKLEGFSGIGIEREAEYVEISKKRIEATK